MSLDPQYQHTLPSTRAVVVPFSRRRRRAPLSANTTRLAELCEARIERSATLLRAADELMAEAHKRLDRSWARRAAGLL